MPYKGHQAITVSQELYDEIKEWLEANRENLKKIGIKKISHVVERAWYEFKENHKGLAR